MQELTRQLVDAPQASLPPLPTPFPTRSELEPLLGCYALQGDMDATLQIQQSNGSSSDVAVTLNVSGVDAHGSATLIPYPWGQVSATTDVATTSTTSIMPLALALRGNDTVVVRPRSVSSARVAGAGTPLQDADVRFDRREVFFMTPRPLAKRARLAQMAVLHINGWDLYANRTSCAETYVTYGQ